jgi:5-(carboxyamino)imidazole ribonucleotide synthase
MFLTRSGELWINEVAPRPHNSGHFTIEAGVTCEVEQRIRAVMRLPLGDTDQLRPAAMINVLGRSGRGPAQLHGMQRALAVPGASVHVYGKRETSPKRTMGHATVLASTNQEARDRARTVRDLLRVSGAEA